MVTSVVPEALHLAYSPAFSAMSRVRKYRMLCSVYDKCTGLQVYEKANNIYGYIVLTLREKRLEVLPGHLLYLRKKSKITFLQFPVMGFENINSWCAFG